MTADELRTIMDDMPIRARRMCIAIHNCGCMTKRELAQHLNAKRLVPMDYRALLDMQQAGLITIEESIYCASPLLKRNVLALIARYQPQRLAAVRERP